MRISVGKIATALGLVPGTATTMMKHLAREGYIDYVPRQGVSLTPKGRQASLQVLRRHRLIELFLVEVMHLDWAHVHDEAEVLEHVISDRMVERIDEMLGRPAHDPHGDPIPDADGVMRHEQTFSLNECELSHYRLVRVSRDEPAFLTWLQERGLRPGTHLELLQKDCLAGIYTLRVGEGSEMIQVGEVVAASLWVR